MGYAPRAEKIRPNVVSLPLNSMPGFQRYGASAALSAAIIAS
jgi:hypothetical protein